MKYALVNNELQEAQPGLSGTCNCCGSPTIAKCGDVKIKHWAHRGMCDPWWEGETEWHRKWKGEFPKEWQEFVHTAVNGEKHIADVKTEQGYVIEFQHSHIKLEERYARESFYKKMIWIIDGTRRKRDREQFIKVWEDSVPLNDKVAARRLRPYFDHSALLRDWGNSRVPVFFDFGEDVLWGLRSQVTKDTTYIIRIERNKFIASLLHPTPQMGIETSLKSLDNFLIHNEERTAILRSLQAELHHSNRSYRRGRPRF